ncbi:MAG: 3-keto-5-aminohexanoate cleavage protein [Nitrososphaerota archaeon]|nr:3-keto-5-aminohexanoate cleavage protein [Nitrososphaerota archaeon]
MSATSPSGGHRYIDIVERLTYRMGMQDKYMDFTSLPRWEGEEKVIIGIAGYGVFIDKEQNPNQPISAEECVKAFEPCVDAGAKIVHVHARGLRGGLYDPEAARTFLHNVLDPLREKYGRSIVTDGVHRHHQGNIIE